MVHIVHFEASQIRRRDGNAAAKSLQLCPTLCDHTDGSPPGSSVPGILQARILEWVDSGILQRQPSSKEAARLHLKCRDFLKETSMLQNKSHLGFINIVVSDVSRNSGEVIQ